MATRYAARLERIVRILIEVKCRPRQKNDNILSRLGVSRAQYYKDRKLLNQLGFRFHFDRRRREFVIDQDRYLPTPDLALSERMALILAVRHLCGLGESTLSHHAAEAGLKLIAGLDGSLPDGVASIFQGVIIKKLSPYHLRASSCLREADEILTILISLDISTFDGVTTGQALSLVLYLEAGHGGRICPSEMREYCSLAGSSISPARGIREMLDNPCAGSSRTPRKNGDDFLQRAAIRRPRTDRTTSDLNENASSVGHGT